MGCADRSERWDRRKENLSVAYFFNTTFPRTRRASQFSGRLTTHFTYRWLLPFIAEAMPSRRAIQPRSPWAQRMIQFELALLYFAFICWKVRGAPWVQGTALYYVYHLDELHRFPVPSWFLRPTMLKVGIWAALALGFSLGVLIWVRDLRYILLALGVLFHLWLEYSITFLFFSGMFCRHTFYLSSLLTWRAPGIGYVAA
jgi:hypothetical protein